MLKDDVFRHATQTLGFDDCRFCSPFVDPKTFQTYDNLVQSDSFGDMAYLKRHLPIKKDPAVLLPSIQSAVVLMKNYKNTTDLKLKGPYKIARFAVGQNYHLILQEKLGQLEAFIKKCAPETQFYSGVDSRPISERSLAIQSGIGFLGQNQMIIHQKLGSYFFIAVMLCTHPFAADPPIQNQCDKCNQCITACPTGALTQEGINPSQCISYRTIEQKQPLSKAELETFDGWLFGCDACQQACPWNHADIPLTDWNAFGPESGVGFDFFNAAQGKTLPPISKSSPLFRSRKQVRQNFSNLE